MKKNILLIAVMLVMAGSAMAQQEQTVQKNQAKKEMRQRPQEKPFTVDDANQQMIQDLQLDEKQATKVQKLNKKFSSIIEQQKPQDMNGENAANSANRAPRGGMGGFGGGPQGGFGGGPQGGFGGGPQGGFGGPGGDDGMGMPGNNQNTQENLETKLANYEKKLKKIVSEEQFAAYQKIKPKFYVERKKRELPLKDIKE